VSLILPPFYFADETDNLVGSVPQIVPGTAFTFGANNADGAAVEVIPALEHDVHYLVVSIAGSHTTGANTQALLDVLVDPAGGSSWSELISDLVCGMLIAIANSVSYQANFHFPLYIKAGSSIGVRARTAHSADVTTGTCVIWAYGNPSRPDAWWCGQKVESLGINPASSQGTDVTPGTSSSFGSWTDIGSTTSARYGAIQFGVNGSDGTAANAGYYWQIGCGSNKLPGSPTIHRNMSTNEVGSQTGVWMPIFADIAAGTQMQARAACNAATTEVFNMAIYGVY
jgi:hypothetical protein